MDKDGVIIYVGKAKNLKRRVSSYFNLEHEWAKTRHLVANIADIKYIVVNSEQDAFLLENNLIKQYQPKYNILLKDGKSYPSICITKEDFPRIFKTRKIIKGIGEYYGPYSYGNTVDLVIELIHKILPLRTCSIKMNKESALTGKHRVCLKYHLKNCCGVCAGIINQEKYLSYIDAAKKIIRGDAHEISKRLMAEMQELSAQMRYEEAADRKEKLELIEKFRSKTIITNSSVKEIDVFGYEESENDVYVSMLHVHNGSIVQGQTIAYRKQIEESKEEILGLAMMELREQLQSNTQEVIVPFIPDGFDENLHFNIAIGGDKKKLLDLAMQNVVQYKNDQIKQQDKLNPDQRMTRVLSSLQKMLGLKEMPVFIDSFDNSHIQGSNAVGCCVVFRKAKPSKSEYKRYSIQHLNGADDYASMREVVRRRYQDILDENGEIPQLIIADGGEKQIAVIRDVIENQLGLHIPVAGLKKDDKHRTATLLYGEPISEFGMRVTDEVFQLMVKIQDEVHRFAIDYHKKKRSKTQIKSELDDIQGVGEKTKAKLLQMLGSVEQIISADCEQLQKIVGNHYGSIIYTHFHGKISH